ncbi:MAG: GTP cyclohydrolase II, partial [Candidatus Levybacteria bacterium]|nr:GTP cyclohydrolase II [Candidatus Levybacteria bacterium]
PHQNNTEITGVQFTVTVDAHNVTSFGISAADRAKTIQILASKTAKPSDLVRPGHVFPLLARDGGIQERTGHTEATVELCTLAGFSGAGVLCEMLDDKGKVLRLPELKKFCKKTNLKLASIADLIQYIEKKSLPKSHSKSTIRTASTNIPTKYGTFRLFVYASLLDNREQVVLQMGENVDEPVLTRIHSQCLTGDTFHSLKCDCHAQLQKSLKVISKNGHGVLLYLNQEGRGIGLTNKIKAYALQEKGLDTIQANKALGLPADARNYEVAAEILHDLGVSHITLLTNNPTKVNQLAAYGITVVNQMPLETSVHETNKEYLRIKKQKLGHLLKIV